MCTTFLTSVIRLDHRPSLSISLHPSHLRISLQINTSLINQTINFHLNTSHVLLFSSHQHCVYFVLDHIPALIIPHTSPASIDATPRRPPTFHMSLLLCLVYEISIRSLDVTFFIGCTTMMNRLRLHRLDNIWCTIILKEFFTLIRIGRACITSR